MIPSGAVSISNGNIPIGFGSGVAMHTATCARANGGYTANIGPRPNCVTMGPGIVPCKAGVFVGAISNGCVCNCTITTSANKFVGGRPANISLFFSAGNRYAGFNIHRIRVCVLRWWGVQIRFAREAHVFLFVWFPLCRGISSNGRGGWTDLGVGSLHTRTGWPSTHFQNCHQKDGF